MNFQQQYLSKKAQLTLRHVICYQTYLEAIIKKLISSWRNGDLWVHLSI